MAQFDVFKVRSGGTTTLVVDLQSHAFDVTTRIVAPLVESSRYRAPITRLTPLANVAGTSYVVLVLQLAAIATSRLTSRIGSLEGQRSDLVGALDLLFTGV